MNDQLEAGKGRRAKGKRCKVKNLDTTEALIPNKTPHFEKGGQGGISQRQSKANPPKSPFLKGGLDGIQQICGRLVLIGNIFAALLPNSILA